MLDEMLADFVRCRVALNVLEFFCPTSVLYRDVRGKGGAATYYLGVLFRAHIISYESEMHDILLLTRLYTIL